MSESRFTYTQGTTNFVEAGEYEFDVVKAIEKESKKGDPMIELQLKIVADDDDGPNVYDYLVYTRAGSPHIDGFREATGDTIVKGERVTFEAEDCEGRHGRAQLVIDEYEGRESNKVKRYLKSAPATKRSSDPF
jgi:hypothetical protein